MMKVATYLFVLLVAMSFQQAVLAQAETIVVRKQATAPPAELLGRWMHTGNCLGDSVAQFVGRQLGAWLAIRKDGSMSYRKKNRMLHGKHEFDAQSAQLKLINVRYTAQDEDMPDLTYKVEIVNQEQLILTCSVPEASCLYFERHKYAIGAELQQSTNRGSR